jgi:hypothetical protein
MWDQGGKAIECSSKKSKAIEFFYTFSNVFCQIGRKITIHLNSIKGIHISPRFVQDAKMRQNIAFHNFQSIALSGLKKTIQIYSFPLSYEQVALALLAREC